jgi:hypothetical protein
MKAETKKHPPTGESSLGGVVIFLLAAALMLYFLVPAAGLVLDKNVASGVIKNTDKWSLSVSYTNSFDGKTYLVNRKIDSRLETYLQSNSKVIPVTYSRYFPENGSLQGVESDHSVLAVVSILVIVTTAFFVIKDDFVKYFAAEIKKGKQTEF